MFQRFLEETSDDPPGLFTVDDLAHELRSLRHATSANRVRVLTRIRRYSETVEWEGRLWRNAFDAQGTLLQRVIRVAETIDGSRRPRNKVEAAAWEGEREVQVHRMRALIVAGIDRIPQLVEFACARVEEWIDDVPGPDDVEETPANYAKWWGYMDKLGPYPAHKQSKRVWRTIAEWFYSMKRSKTEVTAALSCGVRGTGTPTARQRTHRQPLTALIIEGKPVLEKTEKKGTWNLNHPLPEWFARALNEMDHLFTNKPRK